MSQRYDADVAVIGGGVIGLSCAYELVCRGKRVVVLERDRPGSGAGAVAAGMLAPVSEVETEEPAFVDLALESCGLYPQWVQRIEADAGLECGYRAEGSLLLALHRDHEVELERLMRTQRSMGLQSDLVSRNEALEKEPYVSTRIVGGLFVAGDHQVNPRRLTRALAAAIRARGGTILEGEAASPVYEGGHAIGATTTSAEVRAEVTVIAAGAWSGDVWPTTPPPNPFPTGGEGKPSIETGVSTSMSSSAGGTPQPDAGPLPMRPVKGQILRLRGPVLVNHVVRTPDVYLVPRTDGELVVGATSEEQGFDTTITTWAVMDLLRDAWRVLPGVAELELAETSVGHRPALRDHMPAIGATSVPGLFVATGHYRHGVMLSAVTAKLLADVLDGSGSVPSAFDPMRLRASAPSGAA
jgi:glycine oxidase